MWLRSCSASHLVASCTPLVKLGIDLRDGRWVFYARIFGLVVEISSMFLSPTLHFCVLADLQKASCAGRWAAVVYVHLSLLTREDKSSIGDNSTISFDGFLVWALAGTLHRDLIVVGGLL